MNKQHIGYHSPIWPFHHSICRESLCQLNVYLCLFLPISSRSLLPFAAFRA